MKPLRTFARFVVATVALAGIPSYAASISMTCTLTKSSHDFLNSHGTARYMNGSGNYVNHEMDGDHIIISPWPYPACSYTTWRTTTEWAGDLTCGGQSGFCYRAQDTAYATDDPDVEQGMGSPRRCIDVDVEPPCEWSDCDGPPENCPLIVNLDKGPWRLTGLENPVAFDIDADGNPDTIGWTARGSRLAFIALDLNGNGRIDDARELFGNHTLLPNHSEAPDGFVALEQYDSNNDAVIDQSDAAWPRLLLWIDANHDGRSQAAELSAVSSTDIVGLGVRYRSIRRHDQSGNLLRYMGVVSMKNGKQPYYDVFFVER
ncbi:MAG: hypothetical protein DMF56_09365 [Acidobacteria bacterium]|nr:MAG: hypothetical protein DMF56_09365 [Acidobacteriota bacterium]